MAGPREFGKRVLPGGFVAWYRRMRRKVFRAFGGPVTPVSIARVTARKSGLTRLAVRVLPYRTTDWLRRKRVTRSYLRGLGHELVPDETSSGSLTGRALRHRSSFYARVVREDLERTDAVLQALDRRIEGISARATGRLNHVIEQLDLLEREVTGLEKASGGGGGPRVDRT